MQLMVKANVTWSLLFAPEAVHTLVVFYLEILESSRAQH